MDAACAAARHNALSGPVDSARRAARPRQAALRDAARRLSEQNPASGVHDGWYCECLMASPIADPGRDPDVKTRACICVIFFRHVLCFSSTRDAPGAAGVYARRLPLLSTTIGRRCGGPAVPATAPAKTQFRLSKGISEPRPVAGSTAERDSFLSTSSWPGSPTFAKASAD